MAEAAAEFLPESQVAAATDAAAASTATGAPAQESGTLDLVSEVKTRAQMGAAHLRGPW